MGQKGKAGFSQMYKIGNIVIISPNFVLLQNCSFPLYLHQLMLVNVK